MLARRTQNRPTAAIVLPARVPPSPLACCSCTEPWHRPLAGCVALASAQKVKRPKSTTVVTRLLGPSSPAGSPPVKPFVVHGPPSSSTVHLPPSTVHRAPLRSCPNTPPDSATPFSPATRTAALGRRQGLGRVRRNLRRPYRNLLLTHPT